MVELGDGLWAPEPLKASSSLQASPAACWVCYRSAEDGVMISGTSRARVGSFDVASLASPPKDLGVHVLLFFL